MFFFQLCLTASFSVLAESLITFRPSRLRFNCQTNLDALGFREINHRVLYSTERYRQRQHYNVLRYRHRSTVRNGKSHNLITGKVAIGRYRLNDGYYREHREVVFRRLYQPQSNGSIRIRAFNCNEL